MTNENSKTKSSRNRVLRHPTSAALVGLYGPNMQNDTATTGRRKENEQGRDTGCLRSKVISVAKSIFEHKEVDKGNVRRRRRRRRATSEKSEELIKTLPSSRGIERKRRPPQEPIMGSHEKEKSTIAIDSKSSSASVKDAMRLGPRSAEGIILEKRTDANNEQNQRPDTKHGIQTPLTSEGLSLTRSLPSPLGDIGLTISCDSADQPLVHRRKRSDANDKQKQHPGIEHSIRTSLTCEGLCLPLSLPSPLGDIDLAIFYDSAVQPPVSSTSQDLDSSIENAANDQPTAKQLNVGDTQELDLEETQGLNVGDTQGVRDTVRTQAFRLLPGNSEPESLPRGYWTPSQQPWQNENHEAASLTSSTVAQAGNATMLPRGYRHNTDWLGVPDVGVAVYETLISGIPNEILINGSRAVVKPTAMRRT